MARKPTKTVTQPTKELGVSGGGNLSYDGFYADDFLHQLRGYRAIRKYREMRDNDPVVGAILTAMDMMIRAVEWRVEGDDEAEVEFVESLMNDMEGTWEEFMSEVLSFLPFGFSVFETVYKRREGTDQTDPTRYSQFTDGRIGVAKLAPRAQWTIERFVFDDKGNIEGLWQDTQQAARGNVFIPSAKLLHFRTVTVNNEPTGRSVLRNAYLPYHYASHITEIESIAIERELNGLPVGRLPSEYLAANASASQQQMRNEFERILRDVKFNDQGYVMLPSDQQLDGEGNPTGKYMVEFELVASNGTRAIDTGAVIKRHQQDIARSVMADFLMLGQSDKGSFALSKSKTDLFLRALEGYLNNIAAVLNRTLLPRVWKLNGLPYDTMPKLVPGEVAPADLQELGEYVRNIAGAGITLMDDETSEYLREQAGMPEGEADLDMMGAPDAVPADDPGAEENELNAND